MGQGKGQGNMKIEKKNVWKNTNIGSLNSNVSKAREEVKVKVQDTDKLCYMYISALGKKILKDFTAYIFLNKIKLHVGQGSIWPSGQLCRCPFSTAKHIISKFEALWFLTSRYLNLVLLNL